MSRISGRAEVRQLEPEKVAYWYFRLNGFFQIENFVVHPEGGDRQRTDADLSAVRFPFRAERLFDDPNDIMVDDDKGLDLSGSLIDIVIAEVKTNQPCTLNGPWTRADKQNLHRVLAAMGCLPAGLIDEAADHIYRTGCYRSDTMLRIRLVAVGRDRSADLESQYPDVTQVTWVKLLAFIWERFHRYPRQKSQVDQWDRVGREMRRLAHHYLDAQDFIGCAVNRMGVRRE